jgi:hypothetical protein
VADADLDGAGGRRLGVGQGVRGPVLGEPQPGAALQEQRRGERAGRGFGLLAGGGQRRVGPGEVVRRLWEAVAPGGHLVVQDYDIRSTSVLPALDSVGELIRVVTGAFTAAGCDVYAGARLAQLFAQAGVGNPDGTDVAGRMEPLATGRTLLEGTFRSVLPTALARGITTETDAAATLAAIDRDAVRFADRPVLWPLLIGAWKRKDKE